MSCVGVAEEHTQSTKARDLMREQLSELQRKFSLKDAESGALRNQNLKLATDVGQLQAQLIHATKVKPPAQPPAAPLAVHMCTFRILFLILPFFTLCALYAHLSQLGITKLPTSHLTKSCPWLHCQCDKPGDKVADKGSSPSSPWNFCLDFSYALSRLQPTSYPTHLFPITAYVTTSTALAQTTGVLFQHHERVY